MLSLSAPQLFSRRSLSLSPRNDDDEIYLLNN
jgi:hypothetical protein